MGVILELQDGHISYTEWCWNSILCTFKYVCWESKGNPTILKFLNSEILFRLKNECRHDYRV